MLADENIPFLIASMAFVVICLLFLGMVMHVRGARYRRAMIDKIRAEESDWTVVATEARPSTWRAGRPMPWPGS
jgi:Na+-transporting methylmalonyl-CoA/oxaloacetate decarboxylase gamma subunit